jgi:arginyl-tRNA synthetase
MKDVIRHYLHRALSNLVTSEVLRQQLPEVIQVESIKDTSKGDFSSNVALILSDSTRAPGSAHELATKLVELVCADMAIDDPQPFSKVEVAGPGFINFFQDTNELSKQLDSLLTDPMLGLHKTTPTQTVVVDLASPSIAKGINVGQLRSAIMGDSVARVLTRLGDTVIRQNHVGDWGTQVGILLAFLDAMPEGSELPTDPEDFYRQAKLLFDTSREFADRSRAMLVKLQAGDPTCLQTWSQLREVSLARCQQVYDLLGVSLTPADVRGESAYNDDLPVLLADLKASGLLVRSDGAQCVFPQHVESLLNPPNPMPLIIQKSDGGYPYASMDLAALRHRCQALGADRVLYFVDQRQLLHFETVFGVARKAKFVPDDVELVHLGFGTLNGCDGKWAQTDTSSTGKMLALLAKAQELAYQVAKDKNPSFDETALRDIARVVGIGVVKFADLSCHRTGYYRFDENKMFRFEGNTAPYLLYAHVRAVTLLHEHGMTVDTVEGEMSLEQGLERELGLKLSQFNEVLNAVGVKSTPHLLCAYLYDVASLFSAFYHDRQIASSDNEDVWLSRLRLTALTARTLQAGLKLLGLETLERM